MTIRNLTVILAATLISACSTVPSATPRAQLASATPVTKASGSACGIELLDLIPIGTWSRQQRAYDAAVVDAGARALLEPKISDTRLDLMFATLRCSQVEGTAIF